MEVRKLKRIGILIGILALLLFIFSNTDKVQISFFLWHPEVPLILLMLILVLIGVALGAYFTRNVGKAKKTTPDATEAPAEQ